MNTSFRRTESGSLVQDREELAIKTRGDKESERRERTTGVRSGEHDLVGFDQTKIKITSLDLKFLKNFENALKIVENI